MLHGIESSSATMQSARWAEISETGRLTIGEGIQGRPMHNSDGFGVSLLKDGSFGADIITFGAGKGVLNHVHEGSHILFVVKGEGFVDYLDRTFKLTPGLCYLIPSMVSHAIRATSELVLIAVGDKHFDVDSERRMSLA